MNDALFESLSAKLLALDLRDDEIALLDATIATRISRVEATSAAGVEPVAATELIPDDVQRSIIERTAIALRTDAETARAAFSDALEFLAGSAHGRDEGDEGTGYSPPPFVDEAWHQFILFTSEYARYCQVTAGRFIHHAPTVPGRAPKVGVLGPSDTFHRLVAAGRPLHAELWAAPSIDAVIDRFVGH